MSEKLRPCPWCGTTPLYVEKYVYDNKWTQYRVGCELHDCDAQPTVDYHYFTEQEAIDAWNDQAVAVENESLKAENAKLRELARHLYACLSFCDREDEGRGCGFCPYRSAGEGCEFELRLLELGIEVAGK